MSSSLTNQNKTREVYEADPGKVVPFFGVSVRGRVLSLEPAD